jgi:hypothetical protein
MAKKYSRNVRRLYPGMSVADTRERITTRGAHASKTMVDFAEDLGRLLGTAQAKATNWLNQRKDVIDELTQLRDTAERLLTDLTGGAPGAPPARRGRASASNGGPTSSAATAGPRTGGRRKMSAAARKEVSQRMRRYWAARRKAKAAEA